MLKIFKTQYIDRTRKRLRFDNSHNQNFSRSKSSVLLNKSLISLILMQAYFKLLISIIGMWYYHKQSNPKCIKIDLFAATLKRTIIPFYNFHIIIYGKLQNYAEFDKYNLIFCIFFQYIDRQNSEPDTYCTIQMDNGMMKMVYFNLKYSVVRFRQLTVRHPRCPQPLHSFEFPIHKHFFDT